MTNTIPGYDPSNHSASPISSKDFDLMKATVAFGPEDVELLKRSRAILEERVEDVLDVWYGFVGSQPHLLDTFVSRKTNEPDPDYLGRVRQRFGQWILDTAGAKYDDVWLAYQAEIGRRHHRIKKNVTDNASGSALVPFRYMVPLVFPITSTLRPFLAAGGDDDATVQKMLDAWTKSVLLQVTLWLHPYVRDGDF